jgi:hypothetical protein
MADAIELDGPARTQAILTQMRRAEASGEGMSTVQLGVATRIPAADLLVTLSELEERGVIRASESGPWVLSHEEDGPGAPGVPDFGEEGEAAAAEEQAMAPAPSVRMLGPHGAVLMERPPPLVVTLPLSMAGSIHPDHLAAMIAAGMEQAVAEGRDFVFEALA